jgi:hypothetical protein
MTGLPTFARYKPGDKTNQPFFDVARGKKVGVSHYANFHFTFSSFILFLQRK